MKNLFKIYLVVLSVLVITSCGGGGGGANEGNGNGGDIGNVVTPTILNMNPIDGSSNVAVDIILTVTFDSDIDESTVNGSSFTLSSTNGFVDGVINYDVSSRTATFTPNANLETDVLYTATLTTVVADTSGNNLAAQFSITFTTSVNSEQVFIRASVSSDGTESNASSNSSSISGDGRYTVFRTNATNLVDITGVSGYFYDLYRHDNTTGETIRLNTSKLTRSNSSTLLRQTDISGDGRYIVFSSDVHGLVPEDASEGGSDIYRLDTQTNTLIWISTSANGGEAFRGNGFYAYSTSPSISADGRYITFISDAANIVPGSTDFVSNVYWYDTATQITKRVSVHSNGRLMPDNSHIYESSISDNGRYVIFTSNADTLVDGDTNAVYDEFDQIISETGNDVFRHDTVTNTTIRVNVANNTGAQAIYSDEIFSGSFSANISADGRYVVFKSTAANLVANDTNTGSDIFRRDIQTGETIRVNLSSAGIEQPGYSLASNPDISADGRFVVFDGSYEGLIDGTQPDHAGNVYVRDISSGKTMIVNLLRGGLSSKPVPNSNISRIYTGTERPKISSDGTVITFESYQSRLVSDDLNNELDVFSVGNPALTLSQTQP